MEFKHAPMFENSVITLERADVSLHGIKWKNKFVLALNYKYVGMQT